MKKMMEMQYTVPRSNTVIREIVEKNANNENFDVDAIDRSMEIVKAIFKPVKRENDGKLKMYLFLIVYKLYIYLNSYLESKFKHPETMLKKNLSFAVRHSNYVLYLEIKKLLGADFSKVLGEWMNAINKKEVLKNFEEGDVKSHVNCSAQLDFQSAHNTSMLPCIEIYADALLKAFDVQSKRIWERVSENFVSLLNRFVDEDRMKKLSSRMFTCLLECDESAEGAKAARSLTYLFATGVRKYSEQLGRTALEMLGRLEGDKRKKFIKLLKPFASQETAWKDSVSWNEIAEAAGIVPLR
jgi:hypothetical protein